MLPININRISVPHPVPQAVFLAFYGHVADEPFHIHGECAQQICFCVADNSAATTPTVREAFCT